MYKTGLVVGKFLPPHAGHHYLINTAKENAEEVYVLVCARPTDIIPAELRAEWIRDRHPSVKVIPVKDTHLNDSDSAGWADYTKKILCFAPEAVFTSESYGDNYAKHLECKHVLVDIDRNKFPISGTQIRQNPYAAWDYLEPSVKAYFTIRIGIVGAESTGKSTLAKSLADELNTLWVEEYGRRYTELKMETCEDMNLIEWDTQDFRKIAREQKRQEDEAAGKANKVLIADTDAFATGIWHERYVGHRDLETEKVDHSSKISLYFLTDVNTPFEQDGLRDGEMIRNWMHDRFKERMLQEGRRFIEIYGTPKQRLDLARDHIKHIMAQPFDYARANTRYGYGTFTEKY